MNTSVVSKNNAKVRVIILNYNQPEITLQCIKNVQLQEYSLDIIVVDNASSEENYLLLEQNLPENVTLLKNTINSGYAAGNNYGIKALNNIEGFEFSLILNNDAFFRHPDAILELVSTICNSNELVAVSPIVANYGNSEDKESPFSSVQVRRDANYLSCIVSYSWFLRRMPLLKNIYENHIYGDIMPFKKNNVYECDSINGCCFLIKTEVLENIGYLDENTFLYFEEIILGRQIKEIGKKCCLLTSVIIDHYQGTNTGQKSNNINWKLYKEFVRSQVHYTKAYLNIGVYRQFFLILVRLIDFSSVLIIQKMIAVANIIKVFFLKYRSQEINPR